MNYNDAFAIDNISFLERKKGKRYSPEKYELQNHDYHKPRLVGDFYLKYFTREVLFEIDILEVKYFLDYHYLNCSNNNLYIEVLKYKILPKIDELIENAQVSLEGVGYYNETKLDNGFVESEEVIHKSSYEYGLMLHQIAFKNLNSDIKKRAEIINEFLKSIIINENDTNSLIWKGKTSHLAYIISTLIEEGYIDAPLRQNGEINSTELSRQIIQSFNFESKTPRVEHLRRYLSVDDDRYQELHEKFSESGFSLPNSKIVS
ncbi:hypothetical protein [Corallibacter sp.]|uniref:hypothetical protein n=1 Tax=Corallibacter sp. TaxID=2038084 RepID=UPI003AB7F631